MFSSWNIAKSAEGMLSRFALKRLCKFLLKKKLGQIILDIDLDQLDVQLANGTLHLSHLALNVDFINQKVCRESMFRVREGSICSLLVKMPWNGRGCEVEIDDLEIVVCMRDNNVYDDTGTHDSKEHCCADNDTGKDDRETLYKSTGGPVNVHEGVKAVAKMIRWLLTSFHIRIKNLIVAFDSSVGKDQEEGSCETLVLRVGEIECGTSISEDTNSTVGAKAVDFLGISHLTNFLKFNGAIVELLRISGDDNGTYPAKDEDGPLYASKELLTGNRGGFCGTVELSIPWENGSLDIQKVDAKVNVEPVIANLRPSTLRWILATWDLLQKYENEKVDSLFCMDEDASSPGSMFRSCSSALPFTLVFPEKLVQGKERTVEHSLLQNDANAANVFLKDSHLISDWVPFSTGNCQNEGIREDDLGASVDQFFECVDEMRSSQSLGSSGMWGWASSVFSTITAASNIASGSLNITTDHQPVQTNLKITLVGVSVTFANENAHTDLSAWQLVSRLEDIVMTVQVYPKEWKFEAMVKHIVLYDHLSGNLQDRDQILPIRGCQENVQCALPSTSLFHHASKVDVFDELNIAEDPSGLSNAECKSNVVKATVFETFSASHFLLQGHSAGQTSFSVELPPFIFWLHFDLVKMVLDFANELQKSGAGTIFSSKISKEEQDSASHCDLIGIPHHHTTVRSEGSLRGNLFLPHARVIVCFPFKSAGCSRRYTGDQFIALDFSSGPNSEKLRSGCSSVDDEQTSRKKDIPSASCSVHLNIVNLHIYHITRAADDSCSSSTEVAGTRFCAHNIVRLGDGNHWVRVISMLWNRNATTGPWILKSAEAVATADYPESKMTSAESGYEFAAASTRNGGGDMSVQRQREIILSSKSYLRVCPSALVVTLRRSQFFCLYRMLDEVVNAFSDGSNAADQDSVGANENQTSVVLECARLEFLIIPDQGDYPKTSLQRELPGSWDKFRLDIQKLRLLSVSNVGAISGARFLWVSHCEGDIWGSISSVADRDLLLISCSNSSNGRGNGEGSNVLSCKPAGSDFVHLWDPANSHEFSSITVKCGTIVAPGGRLDWLEKLSSFFSLPSTETGEAVDSRKRDSRKTSFVLKFLDAALSYEPCFGISESESSESPCSFSSNEETSEPLIACLLASSSLTFSNTAIAGSIHDDYGIRLQDLGLLLRKVPMHESILVDYCSHHLRELGFVKVAGEALVDAILRVTRENGSSWELSCSKSQIILSTCHDTASGLIRLASQIQQLLSPDIEESIVHLQNRWNSIQHAQGKENSVGQLGAKNEDAEDSCQFRQLSPDPKGSGLVGLMDEICEDAFRSCPGDKYVRNHSDRGLGSIVDCSQDVLEGWNSLNVNKTELIEGYCLSDLKSLSEFTIKSHPHEGFSESRKVSTGLQRGNSGWYGETCLTIVEDYVSHRIDLSSSKQLEDGQQMSDVCDGSKKFKGRVFLRNIEINWRMFAGSDWHEPGKTAQESEECGRDMTVCLEFVLSNLNIKHDILPDGDVCLSKLYLSIQDFFLFDRSKNAPWKLVLGYYHSKEHPRDSSSKALKLELEAVRPDPTTPLEEYRLRVALLPILLHLHQRQLDFLIAFIGGGCSSTDHSQCNLQDSRSSGLSSPKDKSSKDICIADEALLPFFQKVDIWPIIIRVDYRPSRVDLAALSGGKYVELVNLVPWKGVELELKHIQAAGVYGWSNVSETIIGEWLEDISQNQIHKLLQGLPPIRSFVAVGSGAAKLVSLPVKNFRRDHRLVKGLQRGTVAFLRSISVEALGLGVHLAAGAQDILLHAECILSQIQPSVPRPIRSRLKTYSRPDQPEDAQHGLHQAYETLSDGFGKSASALIHSPMKTYRRGYGVGSALVTAVRGAPAAAIAPASAAAQALHCALIGVRNSLDPDHKKESLNKYAGPSQCWKQT